MKPLSDNVPSAIAPEVPAHAAASRGIDLSRRLALVAAGDVVIAAAAYLLAFFLRSNLPLPATQDLIPSERFFQVRHHWWLLAALLPALLFFLDGYHEIRLKRGREFLSAAATATALQVLILIAVYFFTGNVTFPRTIFPIYWVLCTAGVVAWRLVVKKTASHRKRRALIVGSSALAEQLVLELERSPELGLEVVGIASDQLAPGRRVGPHPVLGSRADVAELLRRHAVDEVILTPEESSWKDRLVDAVGQLEGTHARISIVPSIYEILIGRIKHFNVRDIPLIEVIERPNDPVAAFSRRVRDLALASLSAIVLLPLWAVVAILIKLADRGPVVFRQERVGQWGRRFRVYKFRTMPEGAEDATGPVLAAADDPRLTPLGRFLRSYRIDESLQLWNVLRGEMSLVGPRPDRPEFVARFAAEIPGYNERHRVKPGITGLAQIRGHYHSAPAIKLKYDLAYIYNYSFLLDLVILLATVRIVVRRQGV